MKGTPQLIKRQLLLVGLIVLIVVLVAFVSVTVATSRNVSPTQIAETEPNNDFDDANEMYVPGVVMGSAWNSFTDTDYFVIEVVIGEQYQTSLIILYSDGLALRTILYDGGRNFVTGSLFSPGGTELSWTAITNTYYIQVAGAVLTETIQTTNYRLYIDWIAPTPTMTPSPTPTPFEINLPAVFKSASWVESQIAPTLPAESNDSHVGKR
jgi:hypothetical protein